MDYRYSLGVYCDQRSWNNILTKFIAISNFWGDANSTKLGQVVYDGVLVQVVWKF